MPWTRERCDCEFPRFTFGFGRTLAEGRLNEPCVFEFLKLLLSIVACHDVVVCTMVGEESAALASWIEGGIIIFLP